MASCKDVKIFDLKDGMGAVKRLDCLITTAVTTPTEPIPHLPDLGTSTGNACGWVFIASPIHVL